MRRYFAAKRESADNTPHMAPCINLAAHQVYGKDHLLSLYNLACMAAAQEKVKTKEDIDVDDTSLGSTGSHSCTQ